MKEQSFKISVGNLFLTVTYFSIGLGEGRREPISEIFDNLSNIHRHSEHEIFFIPDGEMELVTENESMHFSDSAVIVPPDLGHYTVIDADSVFVMYLRIDRAVGEISQDIISKLMNDILSLKVSSDERFYLEKILSADRSSDKSHLISLLFSNVLSRIEPRLFNDREDAERVGKYAFDIELYIDSNYRDDIRLCDLAEYLHICEKQVMRVIKKEYGCTFSEYVNQKRMSVAIMMLKHTDMTVREIAHSVGFDNDNYFCKVFKKKYNETPTEYRNNQKSRLGCLP